MTEFCKCDGCDECRSETTYFVGDQERDIRDDYREDEWTESACYAEDNLNDAGLCEDCADRLTHRLDVCALSKRTDAVNAIRAARPGTPIRVTFDKRHDRPFEEPRELYGLTLHPEGLSRETMNYAERNGLILVELRSADESYDIKRQNVTQFRSIPIEGIRTVIIDDTAGDNAKVFRVERDEVSL